MFRAKKLDLGCFINIKTIRDHSKRKAFEAFETQRYVFAPLPSCSGLPVFWREGKRQTLQREALWLTRVPAADRQALRYCIRNQTLPARTRAEAQLQLTQMHCYTRPTQIRNRCILGGKGRGILRDFKMTRVGPRPDWRAGD